MKMIEWKIPALAFVVGVAVAGGAFILCFPHQHGDRQAAPEAGGHAMTMGEMTQHLSHISGDAFDKAFLNLMIEHHEGAIEMADAAKRNAKHEELKQLADEIIFAQALEIEQMRQWQQEWGY
jgi:uncharacterized protein (DUF305 family)